MSDFIVGLTGGIGSGKTLVSDYFSTLGITIVDADVCARVVVEPGTPALEKIIEHFGKNILDKNKSLNRAKLRQIIFKDANEKQWLESLLHPLIFEEISRQLKTAQSPYALLVSPLLVEAGQNHFCHRVLVVDAPKELQLKRTIERDNNDETQVKAIMASQAQREERLNSADDVIINDTHVESVYKQADKLHQQYLSLSENIT